MCLNHREPNTCPQMQVPPAATGIARGFGRPGRVDVANGSTSRNKHGIPVYGMSQPLTQRPIQRSASRARCVWPKCAAPIRDWPQLHLCNAHVRVVVDNASPVLPDIPVISAVKEPAPEPPKRKTPPRDGSIYYVQVGAHIKLGWTSDLTGRMRQYPPNSVLLAVEPGTRADETRLHKKFAVWRSHGREWYPLVPVLLDHIKRVVAEHGEPETVNFGAKPVEVPTPRPRQFVAARSRSGASYSRSA